MQELETLPALDGRFTNIKLVNMPNGEKRGNFSLVFKAFDKIDSKHVALKFFDLDPAKMDAFRLACFDREHSLLESLLGAARCLQVLSPISYYDLNINGFVFPARYFITEWYDADIDDFFLRQDPSRALIKLKLFNEVVLSIEALHQREICHRDIKADNFRRKDETTIDGVVAIDLGTAATSVSQPFLTTYPGPVGFLTYSAPEAFCGLASNRSVAYLTDIYALGCMLFELFAEDDFWTAYTGANPEFETRILALRHVLAPYGDPDELLANWDKNAPKLLAGLAPLKFPKDGASVPLAVLDIVNDLIAKLSTPNFRGRTIKLQSVRQRIWSAIRCLENESLAKKRAEKMATQRERKRELARQKGVAAISRRLTKSGES